MPAVDADTLTPASFSPIRMSGDKRIDWLAIDDYSLDMLVGLREGAMDRLMAVRHQIDMAKARGDLEDPVGNWAEWEAKARHVVRMAQRDFERLGRVIRARQAANGQGEHDVHRAFVDAARLTLSREQFRELMDCAVRAVSPAHPEKHRQEGDAS